MIILGIDPGTERAGYGVIRVENGRCSLVTAGILAVGARAPERLLEIKRGMDALIDEHGPGLLAIEKLFFMKNRTTGMSVAEARGVMLLSAKEHGIPVREYAPTEVKTAVTGYGKADKTAVLKMVRLILRSPDLRVIDDAADALAIALAASQDRSYPS